MMPLSLNETLGHRAAGFTPRSGGVIHFGRPLFQLDPIGSSRGAAIATSESDSRVILNTL
jgi:hypothetical protein